MHCNTNPLVTPIHIKLTIRYDTVDTYNNYIYIYLTRLALHTCSSFISLSAVRFMPSLASLLCPIFIFFTATITLSLSVSSALYTVANCPSPSISSFLYLLDIVNVPSLVPSYVTRGQTTPPFLMIGGASDTRL